MNFPITCWSLIAKATLSGDLPSRRALDDLCGRYWLPIYRFIRAKHIPHYEAQDLAQDFMLHLLERSFFSRADRLCGRFRSFLLGALVRFLADAEEKSRAAKRGGMSVHIRVDDSDLESGQYHSLACTPQDEEIFDRHWAIAILDVALQRLRSEYEMRHRQSAFDVLEQFLPGGQAVPYEQAALQLGISLAALKTEIHRLRRRLRELLREEVAQTVSAPHEIESEMAYLRKVLLGASD